MDNSIVEDVKEFLSGANQWFIMEPGSLAPFRLLKKSLLPTLTNLKKDGDVGLSEFYAVNSVGQRCDEFLKVQPKEGHILFAGCSVTVGEGLRRDETWANIVYSKIKEHVPIGGYFNVAQSGFTRQEILTQVFSYIQEYGVPKYLFINMPDFNRGLSKISDSHSKQGFWNKDTIAESLERVSIDTYVQAENAMVIGLRQTIESNGGKLYIFSWHDNNLRSAEPKSDLEINRAYLEYSDQDLSGYLFETPQRSKLPYGLTARDSVHYGTLYHEFWANFIYEKFATDNGIIDIRKIRR